MERRSRRQKKQAAEEADGNDFILSAGESSIRKGRCRTGWDPLDSAPDMPSLRSVMTCSTKGRS